MDRFIFLDNSKYSLTDFADIMIYYSFMKHSNKSTVVTLGIKNAF